MAVVEDPMLIVGTESDNPFAIDIAVACGQMIEISDILSLKTFANTEFCPRFISDEQDMNNIGYKLTGKTVVMVSTSSGNVTRNELSYRNLLVARAAKDNGAERVVLIEPDLFFSAQDRGARPEHGEVSFVRDEKDYKKFDGQPFSSQLYGEMLRLAGVDSVITVHNHSVSVQKLFKKIMPSGIQNLCPSEIFADYILHSDVAPTLHSGEGLLICAPDKGARDFATRVFDQLKGKGPVGLLQIAKQRLGERSVSSFIDPNSPASAEDIAGKDVLVFDDMVRTGYTIKECCTLLKQAGARRVVFFVTHFYPSPEVRENLNTPDLDEIITTNTLPGIMNRDKQGRLRKKLTVLKIERWISRYMMEHLGLDASFLEKPLFTVDMSSKNPRWETLRLSQARRLAMEKKQLSLEELSSN